MQAFKDRRAFITFFNCLHESDDGNRKWRGGRAGSRTEKNKGDA